MSSIEHTRRARDGATKRGLTSRALFSFALFVLALVLPSRAHASASVEVIVQPVDPAPGELVQVIYSVTVQNERNVEVTPLDFGGLEVLSDPSPPQIGGGFWGGGGFTMLAQTSQVYTVRVPRAGRFVIRNARVIDAATRRVIAQHPGAVLVVREAPGAAVTGAANADAGTEPDAMSDADGSTAYAPPPPRDPDAPPSGDLTGAEYNPTAFVRVAVDTPEPYLGQQVILRAWLYVASSEVNCEVTREPALVGFWSEPLHTHARECASRWFNESVAGRYMNVGLVRKVAIYPTQAGELTIGPMSVGVELATGGFFRTYSRLEARSPALTLRVREPPPAGRPADYVPGTVGPVQLSAEIDRAELPVGETALITVRATSEGSLASASLALPANVDGVRVRQGATRATHETASGRVVTTLSTEFLVVAERPGDFDLGAVTLPYWDPHEERYVVARVALPALRATGAALPAERAERGQDPALALRPLVERPALAHYRALFSRGALPLLVITAPPLALALAGAAGALVRRASRERALRAEARKNDPRAILAQARAALGRDRSTAVSLAGRALDRALSAAYDRFDGSLSSLPSEVRRVVDEARQACDAARFAGEDLDARDLISRVERAIGALEDVS